MTLSTYSKIVFPSEIETRYESSDKNTASFVILPLQKGFGTTIGNSLRRTLLSTIKGTVFSSIKFSNLHFEYSTIPGVLQDVSEICFNIKNVVLLSNGDSGKAYLKVKGPKKVYASDIELPSSLNIVNKTDTFLFEITSDEEISLELNFESGVGDVFTINSNNQSSSFGEILLDKHFSPVKNVEINVSDTRIGSDTSYDKLEIKIQTNGAISPSEALKDAAIILGTFTNIIANTDEKIETSTKENIDSVNVDDFNPALLIRLKNLEFSPRVENFFLLYELEFVIQLVKLSEELIAGAANIGRKSITEIKDKLSQYGLSFGMDLGKYANMTIEELKSKYSS